jgi:AraC-like DNA-binding protein
MDLEAGVSESLMAALEQRSGSLRELYMEGKILELLALWLAGLSPPTPAARRPALSSGRVQRLHEARAIVAQRMASPPSLRELAAQVAMSTTILKQGFRELFGETVFERMRGLRLQRARRMLVDERASVKEAGSSVGYSSLSHFARASQGRNKRCSGQGPAA